MPQFDVNPVTNPSAPAFYPWGREKWGTTGLIVDSLGGGGAGFANQPGAVRQNEPRRAAAAARRAAARRAAARRRRREQAAAADAAATASGTSDTSASSDTSTGSSDSSSTSSNAVDAFNPLTMSFKTPKQLRDEARRIALLGAANPAELRRLQQQQEYGLSNLTGAASAQMEDIAARSRAGLGGLIGVGTAATGAAQTAEGANLAAAGAPTTAAPAADTTGLTSQALNLSASTMGYAPAVTAIGQRLIGESRSALTKALVDRANAISADTAKYLLQLQNNEYQRAVARETARQNDAMLGLRTYQAQNQANYQMGSLAARNESNAIRAASVGASSGKDFRNALATLALNANDYTSPVDVQRGNKYTITVREMGGTKQITVYGNSDTEAKANSGYKDEQIVGIQDLGPYYVSTPRTQGQVLSEIIPYIIQRSVGSPGGTWSVKKAKQWIRANMPSIFTLPA